MENNEKDKQNGAKKITGEFIKFGIVGVINNLIYLAVYYVIVLINAELYLLGDILGFLISTLNAYFMNNKFVFKNAEKESNKAVLIKTYVVYLISLGIGVGLLYLMVELWGLSDKIAPIIKLCVTIPFNFILQKVWVYKSKKPKEQKEEILPIDEKIEKSE